MCVLLWILGRWCLSGCGHNVLEFCLLLSGCYKCGEEGHISRDCPKGGSGAGRGRGSFVHPFLLLARYVPNVAKRSIWEQCKKYILTTHRPMTDQPQSSHLGKFQMAISPRGVIHSTSCLVLWWGFQGRQIEWRYFRFRRIQDGGSTVILKNSYGDIYAANHPIYSVFGSRVGFSSSADQMALFPVWTNSIGMWEKTMCEE